ncbi:MAG: hypothetical protein HYZ23_08595 [Chloroflexi bacterium]|jgi:hypothetical protein|nr:hypothetical protein [Chloroflexota bacterium]
MSDSISQQPDPTDENSQQSLSSGRKSLTLFWVTSIILFFNCFCCGYMLLDFIDYDPDRLGFLPGELLLPVVLIIGICLPFTVLALAGTGVYYGYLASFKATSKGSQTGLALNILLILLACIPCCIFAFSLFLTRVAGMQP